MPPAISIENLGKRYLVDHEAQRGYRTLRESLVDLASAPLRRLRGQRSTSREEFWALKDVSFEVQPGEVVGIIGRNGAGKSTLLKILSQITKPTTGRVRLNGRVGSLLEVGTGFHPELTGRENIYLNGSILGMSQKEIACKFEQIVDFSGVERFLDTPVKRYSSGMYVRLAFAVAAHLEPEILMIDEVLAVGDGEFQTKCLDKMKDIARVGRTILFVSHDMSAIRCLTDRAVYLKNGKPVAFGCTNEVINTYMSDSVAARRTLGDLSFYRRDKMGGARAQFVKVALSDSKAGELPTFISPRSIRLELDIEANEELGETCVSLTLVRNHEDRVTTLFSPDVGFRPYISRGLNHIQCKIDAPPLSPGQYTISCGLNRNAHTIAFDVLVDVPLFDIDLPNIDSGEISWSHRPWGAIYWPHVAWSQV